MEILFFCWLEFFYYMNVDAPPGFGAPGDPNRPKLAAPIGLGASLSPLSPKQGGKDPSIV